MRPLMAFALLFVLPTSAIASGNEPDARPRIVRCTPPAAVRLSESALPQASLRASALAWPLSPLRVSARTQLHVPATKSQSWVSRHPALFGALLGAGGGVLAAGTMENELFCSGGDEDCFFHGGSRFLVGAGFGAGIGALIGWIGSL